MGGDNFEDGCASLWRRLALKAQLNLKLEDFRYCLERDVWNICSIVWPEGSSAARRASTAQADLLGGLRGVLLLHFGMMEEIMKTKRKEDSAVAASVEAAIFKNDASV